MSRTIPEFVREIAPRTAGTAFALSTSTIYPASILAGIQNPGGQKLGHRGRVLHPVEMPAAISYRYFQNLGENSLRDGSALTVAVILTLQCFKFIKEALCP